MSALVATDTKSLLVVSVRVQQKTKWDLEKSDHKQIIQWPLVYIIHD